MPKQGRDTDTIRFIRTATVASGNDLRIPVSELLEEIGVTEATYQAMSMGTAGTQATRKYRRAMILIYCALYDMPGAQARLLVSRHLDASLPTALGNMLNDIQRVVAPRRLNLRLAQLQTAPATFLAANRIKTGRSNVTTSTATPYSFSWDSRQRFYLMEPPNVLHHNLHITFQGFNIAVTNYTAIAGNPGNIAGAVVLGTIGLTTQLSGCSILYSVNGANLSVAHIMPDAAVRLNVPPALTADAARPLGVLLALRMAHEGDLANPVAGGTLGVFGMVADRAHTALRMVGPRNVRMHGYLDTLGNAYFIALQVGGTWQLFGQQNNPGRPAEGVSNYQPLFP